jgi:hypothetical protein
MALRAGGVGLIDVPTMISGQTTPLTFTIKLTSASPSGNISSVGTETILPGNEIPSDCSMNLVSTESLALTCSNPASRPAMELPGHVHPWLLRSDGNRQHRGG